MARHTRVASMDAYTQPDDGQYSSKLAQILCNAATVMIWISTAPVGIMPILRKRCTHTADVSRYAGTMLAQYARALNALAAVGSSIR